MVQKAQEQRQAGEAGEPSARPQVGRQRLRELGLGHLIASDDAQDDDGPSDLDQECEGAPTAEEAAAPVARPSIHDFIEGRAQSEGPKPR
jgi:hypothetical protein